jgi:hypothetical protein
MRLEAEREEKAAREVIDFVDAHAKEAERKQIEAEERALYEKLKAKYGSKQ